MQATENKGLVSRIWSSQIGRTPGLGHETSKVMEEIRLARGEGLVLTLPGLGSAGYQWFVVVEDPKIVQVTKLERPPATVRGASGSVEEWFSIIALLAGQTMLRFTQRRSFQPDRPPNAVRDILVLVR
jgi:predicted secreted protein